MVTLLIMVFICVHYRKVTLYITHDKSTLYIIMDNQEFIYPYNTDEDYQKVRERMNSYLQF